MRLGAQARPESLPEYQIVRAELWEHIHADCPWIAPSDAPMVEAFIRSFTLYSRVADGLDAQSMTALLKGKGKAQSIQNRRLRELTALAGQLGLTAGGRARMKLVVAKTEQIRQVTPVRSEERALEVSRILQAAHAIPDVNGEPVEPEPEAPKQPPAPSEVVALRAIKEEGA